MARLDDEIVPYFSSENRELSFCPDFELLKRNYFAVSSSFDEYEYVLNRADRIMKKENPENLFFVIAPTLKCNYHCPYCFENQRTSFLEMSYDVMIRTEDFIRSKAEANPNLKCLQVTWFGGEPLLCLDRIREMTGYLTELCRKKNIEYRASIITNGRFLDQKAVDVLMEAHIVKLQISFDGTEKQYCEYKKASAGDYQTTLSNIAGAAEKGLPVLIRINIRNHDFTEAYRLADLLLGEMRLDGLIKIYTAFVNEGPAEKRAEQYAAYVPQEAGFAGYVRTVYSDKSYFNKLAFAHGVSCHLSCRNNCCIGPAGELYKCEHHFGRKEFITGSVFNDERYPFAEVYGKIAEESLRESKCRSCPIFPVCMGGCPNSALLKEQNFDCESFIAHLKERQLRLIAGD